MNSNGQKGLKQEKIKINKYTKSDILPTLYNGRKAISLAKQFISQ